MIFACARRISDGLLSWADGSRAAPDPNVIRQNAVNAQGGALENWQYVELTAQQYAAQRAFAPAYSYLNNDVMTGGAVPNTEIILAQQARRKPKPTLVLQKPIVSILDRKVTIQYGIR